MIDSSILAKESSKPANDVSTEKVRLESVCLLITDGKHGDCQDEEGSGYYFLSAKDVKNGKLNYDGARQITRDDFLQTHRRTQLEPDDLLLSNSGTIGRMALAEDSELTDRTTFQKSVAILKPDKNQVYPRWLFYYLHHVIEQLIGFAGGTAQKNLLLRDLRAFEIELHPLGVQKRIAETLSAYDDLIDNNNRRIALLEEAIHRLYREWFVHLRFPGHEHTPVVGSVPEGWEKRPLGEVVNVNPKTNYEKGKPSPYVPMAAVSEKSMIISGTEERPIKGGPKFVNGDTLLARITPCLENGKTGFVQFLETDEIVASGSTEFIVLREGVLSRYWIYCLARTHEFRQHAINSMVGSDGRQRVQPVSVMGYQVPVPPKPIVSDFGDYAQKIFKQINTLNRQNGKLREARDALLPRLMNGSLPV